MIAYMIETQFIRYPMLFFCQITGIYTHLNSINLLHRAINIFISLLIHLFLLFATIRHYSPLFATIRHYSSLFTTIHHYSVAIRVFSLANRSSFERDNDVFVFGLYIFPPQRIYQYGSIEFLNFWAEPSPCVRGKTFSVWKGLFVIEKDRF